MKQGANPTTFKVKSGEEVTIRIVAVSTPEVATVSDPFVRVADDGDPGRLFRGTIHGPVGQIEYAAIDCEFLQKNTPGGMYRFELAGSFGGQFSPPSVHEPLELPNNFPLSVPHAFAFEIVG